MFTILRIAIGWHFLYEGLVKLFDPNWSAFGYLQQSTGFLNALFKALAENSYALGLVNFLNIAGLILIGLALFLGIFSRFASAAGAFLLLLYYFANPPWSAMTVGYASEGHYLLVNKNLIEAIVMVIMAILPGKVFYGIDQLKFARLSGISIPKKANHQMNERVMSRRRLVKNLVSLPILGGFAFAFFRNHGWSSFEENNLTRVKSTGNADAISGATLKIDQPVDLSALTKPIPKGKIKNVEMGRIICGGNLISGYAHSRDLIYVSSFLKQYFTEKKVMDTFWLCEQCGINTTAVSCREPEIRLLEQYWKSGGKIQWLSPVYPEESNFKENIDMAIDNGAIGAMIMGNVGDEWVRSEKFELIEKTLEYIKSKGVIAGLVGHELSTIQRVEESGIDVDFYMKTMHPTKYWSWREGEIKDKMVIDNYSIDNYWDRTPEETVAFMDQLQKPWIAYKVLAAGAIHPKDGFKYVFENGADFACVGMFDFQVVEDANLLTSILDSNNFDRTRPWRA